jgi:hypothetical protein
MVDLVQKTFREFTIADDESHSSGNRASLTCDLLLVAFSKQIHSKTRIHTWGLSPGIQSKTRIKTRGLSPGFKTACKTPDVAQAVEKS